MPFFRYRVQIQLKKTIAASPIPSPQTSPMRRAWSTGTFKEDGPKVVIAGASTIIHNPRFTLMQRADVQYKRGHIDESEKVIINFVGGGIRGLAGPAFFQHSHKGYALNFRNAHLYSGVSVGGLVAGYMNVVSPTPLEDGSKAPLFPTETLFTVLKDGAPTMFTPSFAHRMLATVSSVWRSINVPLSVAGNLAMLYSVLKSDRVDQRSVVTQFLGVNLAILGLPYGLDLAGGLYNLIQPKYLDQPVLDQLILCSGGKSTTMKDLLNPVLIPQADITAGVPSKQVLHSSQLTPDLPLYRVIRSTIAAPLLYLTHFFDGKRFTDGALCGNNDPSIVSFEYATKVLKWDPSKIHILTVDTGVARNNLASLDTFTLRHLLDIMLMFQTDKRELIVREKFDEWGVASYTYIDFEDISSVPLDSVRASDLNLIEVAGKLMAERVMTHPDYKAAARHFGRLFGR